MTTDCKCEYQKGTCTGLTAGKEYIFRCIAVNNEGQSLPSDASEPMVPKPRKLIKEQENVVPIPLFKAFSTTRIIIHDLFVFCIN